MSAVMRPRARAEEGMALLELLVASALGLVVVLGGISVLAFHGRLARLVQTRLEGIDAAQWALLTIVRDIQLAGGTPSAVPISGVQFASAQRLVLAADRDGDGVVDTHSAELVTIAYGSSGGGRVSRIVGTQSLPLVVGISGTGFRLRYFARDGELVPVSAAAGLDAAQRERVRRIEIEVAIPANAATFRAEGVGGVALRTSAAVRSRLEVA